MSEDMRSNEGLWRIFTASEEYESDLRDRYSRFLYYMSRNRDLFKPVVSEHLVSNGFKPEYPGGKKFALCLTHDIDAVYLDRYTAAKRIAHDIVFFDPDKAAHSIEAFFDRRRDDLWNFDRIKDLEKEFGARSTFFFMALKEGEPDFKYDPVEVKAEMRALLDEGWDVGLHGGHGAFNDIDVLKREKERLSAVAGKEITGYRNHYLRFEVPTTWRILSESGFRYDSTFGFDDCVGFRNGMCHPFRPYDLKSDSRIELLEIPPHVMDCCLKSSMKLDKSASWSMMKRLMDEVERNNGVMTVIWHNNYMYGDDLDLYRDMLRYAREKDAWLASAEQVHDHWMKEYPDSPP
jgi:peptidoglycan/xylan/chitin deacetylase (PgdA/CDA1 family)